MAKRIVLNNNQELHKYIQSVISSDKYKQIYKIPKHTIKKKEIEYEQKIPKIIFQTWKCNEVEKKMYECVMNVIKLNPEYDHYFYNDKECRDFIKENYEKDVLEAYDTLIPGAYKADLWRYCILYKYGGVYLDIKTKLLKPLKELIIQDVTGMYCLDRPYDALLNGIMMNEPKDEYIKSLIEEVVKNVKNRMYVKEEKKYENRFCERGILSVTGPVLCGKKFLELTGEKKIENKIYTFGDKKYDLRMYYLIGGSNNEIVLEREEIMKKNYEGYYVTSGRDDYIKQYREKKIYKENVI